MLKKITLISFCMLSLITSSFACMMAPPKIVNGTSKDKAFQYTLNLAGEMKISQAGKELWSLKINKYTSYYDNIYLIDNGTKIIQIRGNHLVNSIDDIAIYSYGKDGSRTSYSVKSFIEKLQPGSKSIVGLDGVKIKMRSSIDPKFKWLKNITHVDSKGASLVNALGEKKSIAWKKA
jgi:hypothetical protein